MRILGIVLIFAMFAVAAHAIDVSGDWTGKTKLTVNGKVEEDTVYLSLKQIVNIVTGTAGPTLEQQNPIRNGKVEGNRVILEVPVPNGSFKFDLYLEDEHLKGDVIATAQGQTIKAVMDAIRVTK
jgi:hypothetical protein